MMSPRPPVSRRLAPWILLAGLLAAVVLGTVVHDRTEWPSLVGDEATYLMQAESLAFDLDLIWSAADYDRFVRHWGQAPEGVILQKGAGSDDLVYGKPFFYAAWAAPFTRVSPTHGPFVANALLLAIAALVSALALRRPLGAAAPLWVAVFVFGSVTFAHVFWAHIDLFLACCTAIGLALIFGAGARGATPETAQAMPGRSELALALLPWAAAGVLLAMVAFSRPLYVTLLVPALLAARVWGPRPQGGTAARRWAGAAALAAGAVLLFLFAAGVHEALAGSWTSYGAERRSFNSTIGFPGVDVPATAWGEMIREWGNASWLKRRDLRGLTSAASIRLWAWNGIYFLAGRSVGLLPYFAPALLGVAALLAAGRGARGASGAVRWALLAAALVTAAGFLVIRPFNFYGGGGSLANRYFLPVYPALWFLVVRPERWIRWLGPAAALVVAAPFLWPLWASPAAYPVDAEGVLRHVSPAAARMLPFETTQNHLKPGGQIPEYLHQGLWIKLLDPALTAPGEGAELRLEGAEPASLLLGHERPLEAVELLGRPALPPLEVGGGEIAGSGRRRRIELDRPAAVHPMWWTSENFYLYELTLDPDDSFAGGFSFTLRPLEPLRNGNGD